MYNSSVSNVGNIAFPSFKPERIYMQKFFKNSALPKEYRHWQDTVDQMIDKVDTDQPMYLMVDSSIVKANTSHRRVGRHIDGYWIDREEIKAHSGMPNWIHDSRKLGFHSSHRSMNEVVCGSDIWSKAKLDDPEALILASSYTSSRGYVGEWNGIIGDGGSCENVDVSNMKEVVLENNNVYISNVGFIHESLPVHEDVERTLVRINVKNWEYN